MADTPRPTEQVDPASRGIDTCSGAEILSRLLSGQRRAAVAVEGALAEIERAVGAVVERLAAGGRLVYLAAGSPALIALADALEIPQTYGEDPGRFTTILAGGLDLVRDFAGGPEDSEATAIGDVAAAGLGPADCVLAVSASGSTPYVLAGLREAKRRGAVTIAVGNNPGAPLLSTADIAILLDTGPEMVCGSTRMAAGTAQKIVLNMISTAVAIRRGHVHDGHMVALRADNAKLRERARRMVVEIAGVSPEAAGAALDGANGAVKPAVMIAAARLDPGEADARLAAANGNLRQALAGLGR